MNKLKVLVYSDDYRHVTGFSSEVRPLLRFLEKDFELHYFSVFSNQYFQDPVPSYPSVINDDVFGEEAFAKLVEKLKPDVVFSNQDLQIIARCVVPTCVKNNIPVVNWDIIDCDKLPPQFFNTAIGIDSHIYQTEFTRDVFEQAINYLRYERWPVIHPPLHEEFYQVKRQIEALKNENNKKIVLCVAKNIPRKFLPTLLEATKLLDDYSQDFDVIIHSQELAGNVGVNLDIVRKNLGLKNIVLTQDLVKDGNVIGEKDLVNLYLNSDLFVLPSGREGVGMPLVEAMACGVPCISTNHSANAEVLNYGDRGYLIDPVSYQYDPGIGYVTNAIITPKDLAKKMYEVLFDTNYIEIENIVQKGYEFTQQLHPKIIADKISEQIILAYKNKKPQHRMLHKIHIM